VRKYRVHIFAKGPDGPEIYEGVTIEAEDEASARASAESQYRRYESWAIQSKSKHQALFYEIFDGDRLIYSSNPFLSTFEA
jgi:hypothetical protein